MLHIGIIGCGRIVEQGHAPAWAELSDLATVTGLADPNPARLALVGEALGIGAEHRYTDYRTMLAEQRFDLIDAAVPHSLHRPVVEASAAAGAHVLSEKPLAASLTDIDAMSRYVSKCGVQLGVVHNYLFLDSILAAVRWRSEGRVGRPFLYRNEWVQDGHYVGAAGFDPDWRTKAAVSGGGCLLDEGYHSMYLAEHLMGSPITGIYSRTATYRHPIDVDDSAFLLCHHRDGGTSTVTVSWAAEAGGTPVHELHGSGGTMTFTRPGAAAAVRSNGGTWEVHDEPYVLHRSFTRAFRDALESLLAGGQFRFGVVAARRAMALISAAYRSAATGVPVVVPADAALAVPDALHRSR